MTPDPHAEHVAALAEVLRRRLPGLLAEEYGQTAKDWAELGSTRRIGRDLAATLAASPAMRDLLADVAARARIVGAEITCFSTPELSDALAQAVAPLLESPAP